MKKNKEKYVLGNWLRGFFEGDFENIDQAWSYLSNRFLLSYPSTGGRHVYMHVEKKNEFGFKQLLLCKEGVTEINSLSKASVLRRGKSSNHRHL